MATGAIRSRCGSAVIHFENAAARVEEDVEAWEGDRGIAAHRAGRPRVA